MCLMKSPKNFEKIASLKIWWLVFFSGVKIHFGEKYAWFAIEILIHGSKNFLLAMLWSEKVIKKSVEINRGSYSKWIRQKCYQFFINKKLKNMFYFFTCILTNYVPHEITKEFWKNSQFENMLTGFLMRCQNSLLWEICLICNWNIVLWVMLWVQTISNQKVI